MSSSFSPDAVVAMVTYIFTGNIGIKAMTTHVYGSDHH